MGICRVSSNLVWEIKDGERGGQGRVEDFINIDLCIRRGIVGCRFLAVSK